MSSTGDGVIFAEQRISQMADEFTKSELQIAAIIFAFIGFFGDFIKSNFSGFPAYSILLIKIMFALSVFGLLASLVFGLIELKRKEQFWNGIMFQRIARAEIWREVLRGEKNVEQALAFQDGSKLGSSKLATSTPSWPWILQTLCLSGSVLLMLMLFVIYIVK